MYKNLVPVKNYYHSVQYLEDFLQIRLDYFHVKEPHIIEFNNIDYYVYVNAEDFTDYKIQKSSIEFIKEKPKTKFTIVRTILASS